MSETEVDPITLEITWNGLKSIADECFITIMRSAFSSNVKERHDHSTAIADATGRLIVQAEMSLPVKAKRFPTCSPSADGYGNIMSA